MLLSLDNFIIARTFCLKSFEGYRYHGKVLEKFVVKENRLRVIRIACYGVLAYLSDHKFALKVKNSRFVSF